MSSSHPKISILLATCNGAHFLEPQLDSLARQTHQDWELIVSDDGSTDRTRAIIAGFAQRVRQKVVLLDGPQQGFWQNFAALIRSEESSGDLLAYSDQDDVWFDDKLERAARWLAGWADRPALYFSRSELITASGVITGVSPLFTRPPVFRNALVQNIGGGNTMVFNRAAVQKLREMPSNTPLVSHDWWTYQVVTGVGGMAHYDSIPSLQYRQHGSNIVGSNRGLRARLVRMQAFVDGRVVRWNDINLAALNRIREALSDENKGVLDCFSKARHASWPKRLWLLWRSGVYRQTVVETLGMYVGALFSRL